MNRLEKTVAALSQYPKSVLSTEIGKIVKLVGTTDCQFEEMTTERVIVSLGNEEKVQNHIGQIHAAAMMLIAETATGMVVGMNIPDDKLPLMKSMSGQFVKRSTGAMRAVATLTPEQIQQIKTLDKGEVVVPVTVTDEKDVEPVICEMVWAWVPMNR